MASSTRNAAIELWGSRMPVGDPQLLAKILFCFDNPPGTQEISGSQDSIGIACPGLNKSDYAGEYWPVKISSVQDESVLQFIEDSLYLIPLGPRHSDFHVLDDTRIDVEGARALSDAAESCWKAILSKDVRGFGCYTRAGFEAQVAMFPNMLTDTMLELIEEYRDRALGWKVSGAGGGGYLILVSDQPIENAVRVIIRRLSD
jgi:galactokinase/mevalonate kinase-like predicted kinase